jgi:23S rRNA (adenine2503-C2)-methyltransferase
VTRPHLFGLFPEELAELAGCDVTCARRYLAHRISYGKPGLPKRRPSNRVVRTLEERVDERPLEVVERATDPADGFVKYLFRSPDGALSEAVRIPLDPRHGPQRFTVCLSSQVGCAMQCVFCATGRLGLTRNLEAWEIVSAFCRVRDEAPGRVSGAVFMGQGEPFHNYDEVIRAARVLSHPCGGRIAKEAITISTVGLVPQIRRYTEERHGYRLIVSLTSAIAETRRSLLPVAGRFALEDLADALRAHARAQKGRLTIAWVLLGGVNHGEDEARALEALLGDVRLRVNLIDVNDPRPDGFRRASDADRSAFMEALQPLRAPIVRRYSGGSAAHAACGMLAAEQAPTRI